MILLTGASGFIGKHLQTTLADRFGVENIVLLTSKPVSGFKSIQHENYKFSKEVWADSGINSIDTVIHAGAFTPKNSNEANNWNLSSANISSTAHLLNNIPNSVKKFIFLSTLDVYGKSSDVIDENSLVSPESLYGQSKLYCEKMLQHWAKQENKIVQILRIGHIYGPGEDAYQKLIPVTIRTVLQNKSPIIYSSGTEKRSYLYISECVRAICNSIQLNQYYDPINIVSSKPYPIKEIVHSIIEISKKNIKPEILNQNIPVYDIVFNNDKMKKYLTTEQTDIKDGLKEEYEAFMRLAKEVET
jgi:UDP-glucose 4-epimerase